LQGFLAIYLSFFTAILFLLQGSNHTINNEIIDTNINLQGFVTYFGFFWHFLLERASCRANSYASLNFLFGHPFSLGVQK
jgi:hypothetical protein